MRNERSKRFFYDIPSDGGFFFAKRLFFFLGDDASMMSNICFWDQRPGPRINTRKPSQQKSGTGKSIEPQELFVCLFCFVLFCLFENFGTHCATLSAQSPA